MADGISIGGLVTGLDTASLIQQLVAIDRLPQQRIDAQRGTADGRAKALDDVGSKLAAIKAAAAAFTGTAGAIPTAATSSAPSVVTAAVSAGAPPGALTFRVAALAAAHQVTSGALSSPGALVGTGTLTACTGLAALGVSNARAQASVAAGSATFTVTQSSAAASLTGSAVSAPVTIDGTNDALDVVVNGVARTVTIADGTYATASDLAAAVTAAFGGDVTASVSGGALALRTSREGSAATLDVTGGSGLAALGLSVASAAGTDALVKFGADTVAVSSIDAGGTATVTTTAGSVDLTFAGGLRTGTASMVVARADGTTTVADLAASLSVAGGPIDAAALATGSDTRLVVSARTTGTANAMTFDVDGMAGLPAGFTTIRTAADAQLVVGTGAGAVTVARSTNTVSDVLSGVTLNLLQAAPASDVTVTVARDADALSTKVKALVEAVNAAVGTVKGYTTYDAKSGRSGPLSGDPVVRGVLAGLFRDTSGLSTYGVSAQRDGSLAVNDTTLRNALRDDPTGLATALSTGAPSQMQTRLGGAIGATGSITAAADGARSLSRELQARVDAWEPRLAKLEDSYRARFAALEAAIGSLRNQSAWLSSQIAGLGR